MMMGCCGADLSDMPAPPVMIAEADDVKAGVSDFKLSEPALHHAAAGSTPRGVDVQLVSTSFWPRSESILASSTLDLNLCLPWLNKNLFPSNKHKGAVGRGYAV
jgi:hypothetical protein